MIQPKEYDISYFDGELSSYQHRGGYTKYGRPAEGMAKGFVDRFQLAGRICLELGCAKGFLVEDLRALGVHCLGLEVSDYAISCASETVKPFMIQGDARSVLERFPDREFDVVFSHRFLECIPEEDLPALVAQLNRVSERQFHVLSKDPRPEFYLAKPIEWWLALPWASAILVDDGTGKEYVI